MPLRRRKARPIPPGPASEVRLKDLWKRFETPPPPGLPDLAERHLATIAAHIGTEDEWTVRGDRSLTWWSGVIPVTVEASRPLLALQEPHIRLTATMRLFDDLQHTDDEEVRSLIRTINETSVGWFLCRQDDALVACTTHYAHPSNSDVVDQGIFAGMIRSMQCQVTSRISSLAETLTLEPCVQSHPVRGQRLEASEEMMFVRDVVVPGGKEPNQWEPSDLESLNGSVSQLGVQSSIFDSRALLDYPYRLQMGPWRSGGVPFRAVHIFNREAHPEYGNGLDVYLWLPERFPRDPAKAHRFAERLNQSEASENTGFDAWGAWHVEEDEEKGPALCYRAFVPSLFWWPDLIKSTHLQLCLRTQWAADRVAIFKFPSAHSSPPLA